MKWAAGGGLTYEMIKLVKRLSALIRGKFYTCLIRIYGGECGKNLRVDRGLQFKYDLHSGIKIGNNVIFGRDITIDLPPGAKISIGNNTRFTGISFLSANKFVSIGSDVLVAEMVSIRDADHGIKISKNIREQNMNCEDIVIKNDVWIGKGAIILKGSNIENGCVVGAGCVFNKKSTEDYSIYVGVPAKKIGSRHDK